MTWLEIAALCALFIGIAAGGYLVAQRPSFWLGLGNVLLTRAWPYIAAYVTRRNSPEIEKAMADCVRRGGTWNNFRKRCE